MKNEGKKFDIVLMNPPYSNKEQFLDIKFVKKSNKIANYQIVVHPAKKWVSDTKLAKNNAECKHLKSLELYDASEVFNISTQWKYIGIFEYDNNNEYEYVNVLFKDKTENIEYNDYEKRKTFYKTLDFSDELKNIVQKNEDLYKSLIEKNKTMVNDGKGWIYEENEFSRGKKKYGVTKENMGINRVKAYLKEGEYKFCLYKGSFNHKYNEVQEWKGQDPDKLFSGQICWLTNKENVKNNIKYWLECPLADLWRRYKFKLLARDNIVSGCAYGQIPALDFDQSEDKFKEYVDSLNKFSKEDIEVMKEFNIHNVDKLKANS